MGLPKSSTNQGVYCVKYFTLEAGSSYIWKIAVKLEGGDQSKKIQYALKVTSGKGENSSQLRLKNYRRFQGWRME